MRRSPKSSTKRLTLFRSKNHDFWRPCVSYLHLRSFFPVSVSNMGSFATLGWRWDASKPYLGSAPLLHNDQLKVWFSNIRVKAKMNVERITHEKQQTTPSNHLDFCGGSLMFDLHNKKFTAINLIIHLIVLNSAQHRECWNRWRLVPPRLPAVFEKLKLSHELLNLVLVNAT